MKGFIHKAAGVCSFAIAIAFSAASSAQQISEPIAWDDARLPPEVRLAAARFLSHRIHIDGATDPDKLGIADLLRGRLLTIASEKAGVLDGADRALFSIFAAEEEATLARFRETHQHSFRSLCTSHLDQQPKELAAALTRLEEQEDQDLSSFYQQAFLPPSAPGRGLADPVTAESGVAPPRANLTRSGIVHAPLALLRRREGLLLGARSMHERACLRRRRAAD